MRQALRWMCFTLSFLSGLSGACTHNRDKNIPSKTSVESPGAGQAATAAGGQASGDSTGCGQVTRLGDPICCGRPDELPNLSCIDLSDGGTEFGDFEHCLSQGQGFDARQVGAACCDGLSIIEPTFKVDGKVDCNAVFGSHRLCSACGNGNCEDVETVCNCPGDCK
jgi:hypothetical protein